VARCPNGLEMHPISPPSQMEVRNARERFHMRLMGICRVKPLGGRGGGGALCTRRVGGPDALGDC